MADETERKVAERPDLRADLLRGLRTSCHRLVRDRVRAKRKEIARSGWNFCVVGLATTAVGLATGIRHITGVGLGLAAIGAVHAMANRPSKWDL